MKSGGNKTQALEMLSVPVYAAVLAGLISRNSVFFFFLSVSAGTLSNARIELHGPPNSIVSTILHFA